MADVIIRQVRRSDAEALAALWHRVFEDPPELSRGFLEQLPELGGGVCAEEKGELLGAAYAVAVAPEARGRGLGQALSRRAAELGRSLGAGIVCTSPAQQSLFPWYERCIGVRPALRRREERVESRPGAIPASLSPEEYGQRREALLAGRPHVRPGPAALRREKFNCRVCGGDLLAVGEGIAAVYAEEGLTLIRELLAPAGEDRLALAAALGAALGTQEALLLSPSAEGEPCLAADGPLPPDCVWGLIMD